MINRFPLIFSLIVFALGLGLLLSSFAVWLRFHVQIPTQDIIPILPLVESGVKDGWGSISLQDWLSPISGNAHRILVTRFLMLVDYSWMDGSNYAIYLSAWVSIALLVLVYLRAADFQLSGDRAGRYFIAGMALIFLCSPTQYKNLVNPISASWFVAMASSAIAISIIISAGKRLTPGGLLLACFFAAIAAFSNFAGVLTCLVLPVVALHQRSRLSGLVVVFAAVFIFFYFSGVKSDHSTVAGPQLSAMSTGVGTAAIERLSTRLESPGHWLRVLTRMIRYTGLHLGTPLSLRSPTIAALAVHASVLLICFQWLLLGYRWCLRKEADSRSVEFFLVMATICLGVSCAIPLGRAWLNNNPLAERYQTIGMVYWLSISCLIFLTARGLDDKRLLKAALVLLAFLPALPVIGAFNFAMPSVLAQSNMGSLTQILGRMGENRFEESEGGVGKLYETYIASHQEFLAAYGFKPIDVEANSLEEVKVDQARCAGFRLKDASTIWPGVHKVFLRPHGVSENPFLTRLELRGNNGEVGMMYAHVPQEYGLRSIFFGDRNWLGYYRGDIHGSMPITLFFDPVLGRRYKCVLREQL